MSLVNQPLPWLVLNKFKVDIWHHWRTMSQLLCSSSHFYHEILATSQILTRISIRTWISNYIHVKQSDVITHPYPNFNSNLAKLLLKLGHEWVIIAHTKQCVIIYPCPNPSETKLIKGAAGVWLIGENHQSMWLWNHVIFKCKYTLNILYWNIVYWTSMPVTTIWFWRNS